MARLKWSYVSIALGAVFLTGSFLILAKTDQALRERFLNLIKRGASAIDPVQIGHLRGLPSDSKTPVYAKLRKQLDELKAEWPGCRFAYILTQRPDGHVIFLVDSEPLDSTWYSPPGQTYSEASDALLGVFTTELAVTDGPLPDRWGCWVSAFAPVIDSQSHSAVAVLGADVDAWRWYSEVLSASLIPLLGLLAVVCIVGYLVRYIYPVFPTTIRGVTALKSWRPSLKKMTVSSKMMRQLFVGVILLAAIFLGLVLWQSYCWIKHQIEKSAAEKADLLARFNTELRDYIALYIRPEFEKRVASDEFLPETMSISFVARHVFENLRTKDGYHVKFTARNPRNPVNNPTPNEERILEYFERNPDATSWSGKLQFYDGGETYFVAAYPRRFTESCLKCHGRPEDAPKDLLKRYGREGGFNRKLGDVSLELVAIPMRQTLWSAANELISYLLVAVGISGVFIAGVIGLIAVHAFREKRLHLKLHENRELLEATLRSIGDGVISCDCQGCVVSLNCVAEQLTGWSSEEARGKPIEEVFPIFDSRTGQAVINPVHRAIASNEVVQLANHTRLFSRSGTWYHIADSCAPIRDNLGHIIGAVLVFRDVTEQYRQREAIRESQAQLLAIANSAQDAIIMVDHTGRITFWNPAAEKIFGYTANEALGLNPHDLMAFEQDREAYSRAWPEFVRTGQGKVIGKVVQLQARRKDGQPIYVELSLAAVSLHDRWQAVAIVRDIGLRKRSEEQLQKYATALEAANKALEQFWLQAEAATKAKSEFLANMSHEIRTPMTAILGYAEILLDELKEAGARPDHLQALRTIQRNGNYLLELINDILDLSKIEAGRLEIERKPVDLPQLLDDVVALMRVRAESKQIPLTLQYAGHIPKTIQSDPTRLKQILINLVGNAIKFTETGEVRLNVRLTADCQDSRKLQIDVIDSGIGISPEKIQQIFQPFTQGDSSTTRKYGGTGLGLTISQRLAELLGGTITVMSQPGKGSTFSLIIDPGPIEDYYTPDQSVERATATPPDVHAKKRSLPRLSARILLAEDAPDNQRLISFILQKAGATVSLATNGQEAVRAATEAQIRGEPFDIILMDMQMPEMDGYQATRYLREKGYSGIIVALTAHALADDSTKCLEAGCDAYLTKPIRREEFLNKLAAILATKRDRTDSPNPDGSTPESIVV
ncbi:MAG: PAS domain S-box protein [Thermogutta sp.]